MSETSEMRNCPKCGKSINAAATRCEWCWEKVQPIQATTSHSHGAAAEGEMLPPVTPAVTPVAAAYPRYRYQVVPFIGTIKTGLFSSDNAQTVSGQLQSLIEHHARHGWDFYSLEKVNIKIEPGCFGQLLGQGASYISFDQVIFRQDI